MLPSGLSGARVVGGHAFARFQDYAQALRPALDAAVNEQLAGLLGELRSAGWNGGAGILSDGKKARGALLCLVAAALGGALESALPRAVAVELIQTATLIHDDFVDQHLTRRSRPALWTLDGARRAVLLGDVLFASAIRTMSELGREDGLIVSRAIAEISRGAYQEPLDPHALVAEIEAGRITTALYERIIRLKTGVLFGAACQLGALAAGAGGPVQERWLAYGLRVGEAYQIADDLHEVEGHLHARSIAAAELAALAPALLFFDAEIGPALIAAARRPTATLEGRLGAGFAACAEAMEAELERRLLAAVAEIDAQLGGDGYGPLARSAPRALIEIFNETAARPSSR
jgi:geranylgeranyl pyrophosphate synthase